MPRKPKANKPARIQVSIDPETKAVIQRLADVMDTSFAKLAGSLLDDSRDQLVSLADAMEKAKAEPKNSFSTLSLAMVEAQRHILDAQSDFIRNTTKEPDSEG